MKRIYLLILATLFGFTCFSQALSTYTFSAFSGTYTSLTGATTASISGGTTVDDAYSNSIGIGFSFVYCGTTYTTLSIDWNGWVVLGQTIPGSVSWVNDLSNGVGYNLPRPIIAPYWTDLYYSSGSQISYKTSGTAPNRTFTVQWDNAGFFSSSTPHEGVQLILYESTNVIDFVYNFISTGSYSSGCAIGLTGGSGASPVTGTQIYWSLNGTGTSPTPSMTTESRSLTGQPATNQVYRWNPQCSGTPSTGTIAATVDSGCSSYTSVLSLPTGTIGNGITYDWQTSSTGSTWTDVPGATADTYLATVTTDVFYRCTMTCTVSGLSATSAAIELYLFSPPSAITGTLNVCAGSTTPLSDATSGGHWSSGSTGIAIIGSGTGVVTGESPGTSTITYTVPAGACKATAVVTVNTTPSPLSGIFNVCVGATTALSSSPSGGAWVSTPTTTATVGPTTGVVTGVASGVANITYFLGSCYATAPVTVNPSPSAVVGSSTLCVGSTNTYTDPTAGGTWSSGYTGYVSVVGSTGAVTGLSAGVAVITYTMPGGCYALKTVTVNGLPVITGVGSVCVGSEDPLAGYPAGGAFTSSDITKATVGAVSGIVTGVGAGTVTIIYTLPTGCSASLAVVVSPQPGPITGTPYVCVGGSVILSDTSLGYWTSSDYSTANVNPSTGEVDGISVGVATISYTGLTSSCSVSESFTVNPLPGSITGAGSVCIGATTTLTDGSAGGYWISSDTTKATVGYSTGVVTGVATGTVTIDYILPTGCYVSTSILVNPLPAAITGTMSLCVGTSAPLADATTPGTWLSSASGTAGVGFTTGLLSGVSAGTATITYTASSTGCHITAVVTVNSTPLPITGIPDVCIGSTTTLSDATGGGGWSSSSPYGTVGSTGIFSGTSTGVAIVTYSVGIGCVATVPVTVNPLPGLIGGTLHVCVGATTTLTDGIGTWSSGTTTVATIGSSSGIVSGISPGTSAIIFVLPTGCSRTANVTVNPLPALYSVTGGGAYCAGSTGLTIGLSGSSTGTNYQLYNGGALVGSAIVGTGGALSFGTFTTSGTYTVVGTTPATGCSSAMSGSAVISVNPLPPSFIITSGTGSYCSGGTGLTICLSGSTAGITYQAYIGATAYGPVVPGTGGPICLGPLTTGGIYTIVATNTATGCTRTMGGTATITVTPTPVITGPTAVCVGSTITEVASVTGGTWSSSSPAVASVVGSAGGIGTVTGHLSGSTTLITYVASGCSASVTVTVSPSPSAILGRTVVCEGLTDTLSDVVAGGSWTSSPATYGSIGFTSGVFAASSSASGVDSITYSLGTGCTVHSTITINPSPAAIVGATALCQGTSTTETDRTAGGAWTSSDPALASIGALSGFVTASSTLYGVDTITYTQGCPVFLTITVNQIPAAISGPVQVCRGASIVLGDATAGGSWSVSGPASISGAGSTATLTGGAVTTATVATVTYSVAGCSVNLLVTVYPFPAVISGPSHVCQGSGITLADATTPGTWSSSVPATGTIDAAGHFTGLATGSTIITYTSVFGCTTTAPVTVNVSPAPVSGPSSICVGGSAVLNDATSGGTWSSSNSAIAPIGSATGVVSGSATGSVVIGYSLGGCAVTFPFGVIAAPAPIIVPSRACVGQPITLTDTSRGGAWISADAAIGTVTTGGVFTGISSGTVLITYGAAGCFAFAPVVVDPLSPVTGPSSVCVGQSILLGDTTIGGDWSSSDLTKATVSAAGEVTGTGAGTVTISYDLPTGCTATKIITVNAIPAAIAGPSTICSGNIAGYTSATSGGVWSSSSTIAPITSSGVVTAGSVTAATPVVITYAAPLTACPVNKTVIIEPLPSAIAGPAAVCIGQSVTLTDGGGGTWASSTPADATIGSVSGVVRGVAIGATTITYTLPTGCYTTTNINVDSLPAPITGTFAVCQGGTVTLSDASTPGTWGSSDPTVATVDGSGDVTGYASGPATISFTPLSGCPITHGFTVNPLPSAIASPSAICPGQTVTLFEAGGGTWSSSDITVVTIGSSSGLLTGIAPVSATLTYTLPTGCFVTAPINVNPPTDPITGNPQICIGSTTSLVDATTGGTWSSTRPAVGSVDAGGVVTGVSLGTATIVYTPPTGCITNLVVTVNPQPTPISGLPVVCQGQSTPLSDGITGGTWTSADYTIAGVDASSGLVTAVITGNPAQATVDITYSLGSGCTKTITVTVNPIPAPISGPNSLCALSTVTYSSATAATWSTGSTAIATITTGGDLTGINPGGSTNVVYTNSYGCNVTYPITVNPQPAPITGSPNVCLGTTVPFGDAIGGGTWVSTNNAVATVDGTTGDVTGVSLGSCAIIYTIYPGGCYQIKTIYVQPLPDIYNVTGGGSYCAEGAGVPIGLDGSSTGTNYLLYHGSTAVGTFLGSGGVLPFGLQTIAGTYHAVAISTSTGCKVDMNGTATVTIIPTVTPSVTINTPKDTVCAGTSALFTPTPVNGGTAPVYNWNVNGVGVGSGGTYTFVPASGDRVTATMLSNVTCPSPSSVTSNLVTMTVTPYAYPTVNISATPNDTVCKGTEVTLNAITGFGGYAPVYHWTVNGLPVSTGTGHAAGLYTYVPANGDEVYVVMKSNYDCRLADDDSNTLRLQVDTAAMPVVTISANPGTVVSPGESATFTASVTNAVNPTYQWYKNGYPIPAATTNVYTSSTFSTNREDSLDCMVTSNGICKITSYEWVYVDVSTVGVQQISTGAGDFTVVPNPNSGAFTVKGTLSSTTDQQVTLELTDVLGQVVYHSTAQAIGGKLNEHVQLANNLANGMYLLTVRTGEENRVFHIVIEQ